MATRRTPAPPADPDEEQTAQPIPGTRQALAPPPDEPMFELSPGERVIALLEGMNEDEKITIRLYRRVPNSQALTWCQNYGASEFVGGDLEMIRSDWGAGEYQIRVYGSRGLISREDVNIAQKIGAPIAAANVNQQTAGLERVMQTLADSQTRILEALQTRPDPMASIMQTAELLKTLQGAAAPQQPQKSGVESMLEMMTAFRAMKEISAEINPPKDTTDPSDPMTMLPGIIDMVKTAISNRSTPASAPVPMLNPPQSIAAEHAAFFEDQTQAQAGPGTSPVDETLMNNPPDDEFESANMQLVQMMIRNYIGQLLRMIDRKQPPIDGGKFIYDKLPDDMIEHLDSEGWFEQLAQFDARIVPHRAWFEAAKSEADKLFAEDEGPEPAPPAR